MNKLIVMLFALAICASAAFGGTVSVTAPECSATFQESDTGTQILAPDFFVCSSSGNPALPVKELHVILPPDADPSSVSVSLEEATSQILDGNYDIAPAPPIVTVVDGNEITEWGSGKEIVDGRNTLVYENDSFYPSAHVELADQGNMREYKLARLRYYPYTYNPVTGRLEEITRGEIVVSYDLLKSSASVNQIANDPFAAARLADLAENYDEAQSWYSSETGISSLSNEESATTNYVIITTSAIASASTKLQAFVNHKTNRGYSVAVVTESTWGGGTGDAAAEKIRAYLKANYLTKGIHYVLLIGNPNPSTGTVPMKMLWPRYSSSTYREAPSDYYFADLTGDWDLDNDGYYGEASQDFGTGGVDRLPDVIVGRIPYYGTITELDSILQKVIDYESGTYGGTWVKNTLLSMKPSDASTPGYNLGEAIREDIIEPADLETTRVYDDDYGLSPAPDYTSCTYANVLAAWQQKAGFHFWWTHGSATAASEVMTTSSAALLKDNYPSFVFQCSCLNGYPEQSTNLGYALLKNGAIATDCATRVSWYYPAEVDFTKTDSNASMTYSYASKLITEGLACGDAHYAMMVKVPNDIWMNHCVFNLYGDPSVACATGPTITHTPLTDTDVTSAPYQVNATIEARNTLASGMPVVKWNTTGGSTFTTVQMTKTGTLTYTASIPAQSNGTTVYYYIQAIDITGQQALSPSLAPAQPYSFKVRADSESPVIEHIGLDNTGDTVGPYTVSATVTDNTGVGSVILHYHKNTGSDVALTMTSAGSGVYTASIPGGTTAGDTISYYITAIDTSLSKNTGRSPSSTGYYSFTISTKKTVAIYNSSTTPSYFNGTNSNVYAGIRDILNADPAQRFSVSVKTSLTTSDLQGQDTLILPDNGPLTSDMQAVYDWFQTGKTIVLYDTSVCYGTYTGLLWPASAGSNGYATYWDYNAGVDDQLIVLADSITSGYSVGDVIQSRGYHAQFFVDKLPTDAVVLSVRKANTNRAYAVYRDVPGHGRIVALGPYIPIETTHYSMIRESAMGPTTTKTITITSPNGGEIYEVGGTVTIAYKTSGGWLSSDKVKLEYATGLDTTWRTISGAESLVYSAGSYAWNTTGLPGSKTYKVRATLAGGSVSDTSDATFTIVRTTSVVKAKSISDGETVKITSAIVTCAAGSYTYIEDLNRLAGIRMTSDQTCTVPSLVTVVGTMSTVNGERTLAADSISASGVASPVGPFAMKTASLGGSELAGQQGVVEYISQDATTVVKSVAGLNNIGLLVRVTGKVTSVGTDYFYIDDGCACNDGSGNIGVKVLSGTLTKPTAGAYVALTGVSSIYSSGGNLLRAIVLPDQDSLQILKK
ncbi:MAG: C25 family peptidase propeptide domain-containing protein [Armatimonadota bacterium]|nr:hypothetical protein [bacterium]